MNSVNAQYDKQTPSTLFLYFLECVKMQKATRKLFFPKEAHSFSSSCPKTIYYSKKKDNNMAWIVGVEYGVARIVNTEWVKNVEVHEYTATDGARKVVAIMFFGDGQTTEVFTAETTASVSTVTELLLNALKEDRRLVVVFEDLIKRAELLEEKEVK